MLHDERPYGAIGGKRQILLMNPGGASGQPS